MDLMSSISSLQFALQVETQQMLVDLGEKQEKLEVDFVEIYNEFGGASFEMTACFDLTKGCENYGHLQDEKN